MVAAAHAEGRLSFFGAIAGLAIHTLERRQPRSAHRLEGAAGQTGVTACMATGSRLTRSTDPAGGSRDAGRHSFGALPTGLNLFRCCPDVTEDAQIAAAMYFVSRNS